MFTSLWNHQLQPAQWAVVVVAAAVAATIDVRSHRIPNALTGPLLLCGMIWSLAVAGWGGLGDSLAGMFVVGVPFIVMWLMQAGGAGDAKMMMALGAWLGVRNGSAVLLGVALAGGVVALLYALMRRQMLSTATNVLVMVGSALFLVKGGGTFAQRREVLPAFKGPDAIPYGVAIFMGTCVAAVAVMLYRG